MSRTAVIGKRTGDGPPRTDEIEGLARTAGYEVAAVRATVAARDKTYNLPPGLVDDLAADADRVGADAVVVDNELTPSQAFNLVEELPEGAVVLDRRRLILEVFDDRAGTERARLEVELARLEYELPRVRARVRRNRAQEYGAYDEEGTEIEDIKRRIDECRRKLDEIEDPTARRQAERRAAGFDLVALAGYTNAGKTTLLRRLADDMRLDDDAHGDLDGGPAVRDRPFETLGTTTRRATIGSRPALLTDTVGFVRDLPHELVGPFEATLQAAFHADVVALVVDASDPVERVREKVATCHDTLAAADGSFVHVLNKADLVGAEQLPAVRDAVASEAVTVGGSVAVSATDGSNLDALRDRVVAALPTERADLRFPNCGDGMALVSWAYDNASVDDVSYDGDEVRVELSGRPAVVDEARRRARSLGGERVPE
jgi:GTP-binding protein HflX